MTDLDELSSKIVGSKCKRCEWEVSGYTTEAERRTLVLTHVRLHKSEFGLIERAILKAMYKKFGLQF